jgi:hypothetical protein
MTMQRLVDWFGQQISWPTGVAHVASRPVCPCAQTVFWLETIRDMITTCSGVKQEVLVIVGMLVS